MNPNLKTSDSVSISQKPTYEKESIALDYSYSKRTLQNGLRVIEIHQPHLHTGAVSVYIKAGSRYETLDDNGLSHFLEHMVFRGTTQHQDTFELNRAVEEMGGTMYAATSPDTTEYGLCLPPENIVKGAAILSEVIVEPIFSNIQIERRVIVEEKKEDLDENGNDIDIDFLSRARLWPDCPLGQSVIGPIENIERFNEADLTRHLRLRYVASNAVVCISGAFDTQLHPKLIDEIFDRVPLGKTQDNQFNMRRIGEGPTMKHVARPGSQTQVRVAFNAFGENDADRTALTLLLRILDDGMSSRLHRRIFDELGLAYNIGAEAEMYADTGALNFDGSTSPKKIARVISEILHLVRELRETRVSTHEFEKARSREIWGLQRIQDDPGAISCWYGEQELFREPPRIEAQISQTLGVSKDDILRVANRIFTPTNLHITSVGTQNSDALCARDEAVRLFQ